LPSERPKPTLEGGPDASRRESGGRRDRALGARSVLLVHTVLRMALADAIESGRLPHNPADRIPGRQQPKHAGEMPADRFWSPDEARAFLEAARDARQWPVWCLALDTGARRGELAGLRWDAVDLDRAVIDIRASRGLVGGDVIEGSTKSGKSRQVAIDSRTVAALRSWKARRAPNGSRPARHGRAARPARPATCSPTRWANRIGRTSSGGRSWPPRTGSVCRGSCSTDCGTRRRPWRCRTACRSRSSRERLGHSKVSITLDVCGHAIPSQGADAARVIGAAIYGVETGS
jgi:integrase